jgi:hypothetical protein
MGYDVIGDVHGHADELVAVLAKLGYRESSGAWRHPERTAAFVGDFVDRGPRQLETVGIVRRMVDAGSAVAVMGNHELNAIAWFLRDPGVPGEYLRPHFSPKYGEKNRQQHARFLAEVDGRPEVHAEVVEWFLTLPLWLELPALRLVHACWDPRSIEFLRGRLRPGNRLDPELMVPASREPADDAEKDTLEPSIFKAVEALTKGIEVPMPSGDGLSDAEGIARQRVRVRWWDERATTLRDAALLPDEKRATLPPTALPERARIGYADALSVFFGHYWLTGAPAPLAPTAACVDYSVAKGGQLCAYRFEGEPQLDPARFVTVRSHT